MKTLFVTVDPAFPPISGVDLRGWQNVTAAKTLGPVLLVSIGRPGGETPPSGIEIGHIAEMATSEVWRSDFDTTFPAETVAQFRSLSEQFQPDVTVMESLQLTSPRSRGNPHCQGRTRFCMLII